MRAAGILAVALALAAVAATVACSAPSIDGTELIGGGHKLPSRNESGDDDTTKKTDPTTTTPAASTSVQTTQVVDGGPIVVASKACAVTDSAVCFTFEGNASDQTLGSVSPSVVTNITFVPGHENEAASFTTGSAMQFQPNAAFELPASSATIEAWIKRQDTGGDAVVFDDDGRFSLTIDVNGHVLCKSSGGGVTGTTLVLTNAWQHVACVVDSGQIRAYLNGVKDATGAGSIHSAPALAASIGANSPPGSAEGDQDFIGLIDSFKLLTVARTDAEIATDATSP